MADEHDDQRVLRLGFFGDAIERAAHLFTRGVHQGFDFGIGAGFQSFLDVFGPHTEVLFVIGLAAETSDRDIVRGCVEGGGGQEEG